MKPRFFRLARKIALTSESKFRVGAVLVRGNAIVGMGCNDMNKSHPIMTENTADGTRKSLIRVHAELAACRAWIDKEIDKKFSLYVYRVKKDGSQGLAKPCDTCFNILQEMNIPRIFFSLEHNGYGDIKIYARRSL